MIISHKYKYIFLENPLTGTTAISSALVEKYDGVSILSKHSNYFELKRENLFNLDGYFIFSAVRNPLDGMVSEYLKFSNDHDSYGQKDGENKVWWYEQSHKDQYAFAQRPETDFYAFMKKFYKVPGKMPGSGFFLSDCKKYCDKVIYFEELQDNFHQVLEMLNIPIEDFELPKRNITKGKKIYLDYYDTPQTKEYALKLFGPFMAEWVYSIPEEWKDELKVDPFINLQYAALKRAHFLYASIRAFTSPFLKHFIS